MVVQLVGNSTPHDPSDHRLTFGISPLIACVSSLFTCASFTPHLNSFFSHVCESLEVPALLVGMHRRQKKRKKKRRFSRNDLGRVCTLFWGLFFQRVLILRIYVLHIQYNCLYCVLCIMYVFMDK